MMYFHYLSAEFWLGLCALLIIIEMLLGSGFLLCFACSAGVMFLLKLLFALHSIGKQLILFTIFSIMFAFFWKFVFLKRTVPNVTIKLNQRAKQYIGREFKVSETINNEGKMPVDDSVWQVRSKDLIKAGSKVVVVGVDGVILLIEKVNSH